MTDPVDDLSEAVVLYLQHYPGRNDAEFQARVTSPALREDVRAMLDETIRIQVEWGEKSLGEIGDEVRDVMRQRHPDLSDAALHRVGNYFTYLVR